MKRILGGLVLVFLITLAVISLTKELVVRQWLSDAFERELNLKVKIQEIYLNFTQPRVTIEGFYILNPPHYGHHWLANIPEVVVDYNPTAFLRRRFEVKKMTLDILEINMVKDSSGQINLNSIETKPGTHPKSIDLFIQNLNLSIRRVTYQDVNSDIPVRVYDLNLKGLKYENVESLDSLCRIITVKILERIGLSQIGLNDHNLSNEEESSNPILKAGSLLSEAVRSLRNALPA